MPPSFGRGIGLVTIAIFLFGTFPAWAQARSKDQAQTFTPASVAFSSPRQGLIGGAIGCPHRCSGVIERTDDGGHSWQVRAHVGAYVAWVDTRANRAWAIAFLHADGRPGEVILRSDDYGATWHRISRVHVADVTFGSNTIGWAVGTALKPGQAFPDDLLKTENGGRTWKPEGSPCKTTISGVPALRIEMLAAVSAVSSVGLVALCTSQPAAGEQAKAVETSTDGGHTWHLVIGSARALGISGYARGLKFLSPRVGWIWESRGGAMETRDGGRTWVDLPVVEIDSDEARAIWPVNTSTGYILLSDIMRERWALDVTRDGWIHWSRVATWPLVYQF